MFGNFAGFVNGNMFAGLFGCDVGVKLAAADQAELTARGGGPYGPPERPMGGYVSLPAAWRGRPDLGSEWVHRAFEYVSALPPKPPRSVKPAKSVKPGKSPESAKSAKSVKPESRQSRRSR